MRDFRAFAFLLVGLGIGCGGVAKEDDDSSPDAGDPADTIAPTVLTISPTAATTQVTDVPVILEFSEPMDRASVAAQFPGASFVWNADGTRVEITIAFPFAATPQPFVVSLGTTVSDVAGNGLEDPFTSSFTLAALHTLTILHDPALSGNRAVGCAAGTFVQAGDQANTDVNCPSTITFGGVSFPLAVLPPHNQILALRKASLKTQVISAGGNLNAANFGSITVDHVIMASRNDLTAPLFKTQNALTMFQAGAIVVGNPLELDVATLLDKSWLDADANFQLRFHPTGTSDADIDDDTVVLRRTGDENDGIVAPGLAEPDEANRMRLELEFFQ
ncbi:MAG: Ig-like domain-containing protein [Kofleriaceae bacterium]